MGEASRTEPIRVLVVEDDSAISDVVCRQLSKHGYLPEAAFSGTEAQRLLASEPFDLVITDLMLPGLPGEKVVALIREAGQSIPIIVISARNASSDKVDLLSLGADDYMTKPFDLDELIARVEVQLRHASARANAAHSPAAAMGAATSEDDIITVGEWTMRPLERTLAVGAVKVPLTRTEFDIAELLARSPKRVFTKQELHELLWNEHPIGQESSVSTHVSNLRAKLKPTGTDSYIQTVWGLGFKLEVPNSQS